MSGTDHTAPAPKRSRKRWFIVWTILGVLGGMALNVVTPRVWRSSTSILIIPQRVPEDMVRPTVTADLLERLNAIQQQILSRTRLERIIQEFNLYERERQRLIMEDVIEQMRYAIDIRIARPRNENEKVTSFSVSFDSTDARSAMQVTERLASLFVVENVEDRAQLAEQTEAFLKGQIEDVKRRLERYDVIRLSNSRLAAVSTIKAEHDVLVETYKQLLLKAEAASQAVNLERRQIGEQFKVIDGARLPERPIGPRLWPYPVLGAIAGLVTGWLCSRIANWWRRRRRAAPAAA